MVVPVSKSCTGDYDSISEDAFCGIPAAVNLRLDLFYDDSLAAFDRFHEMKISPSFQVESASDKLARPSLCILSLSTVLMVKMPCLRLAFARTGVCRPS